MPGLMSALRTISAADLEPPTMTIQYSSSAQMALSGGNFDARSFFKRPRLTGNEDDDELQQQYFRNKVKLMDLLCQKPQLVAGCLAYVENKFLGVGANKTAAALRDQPRWPNTYQFMEKIPKYWRGDFLASNLGKYGLTAHYLAALDSANPTAIIELSDFLLGMHPKTHIPRVCLDKSIMEGYFAERMVDLGRASEERLKRLTGNFSMPPKLDWSAGVYHFAKRGGKIMVVHCTGAAVAPGALTLHADPSDLRCMSTRIAEDSSVVRPV